MGEPWGWSGKNPLPAVVVGRRRRAADAIVRPVEVEAEGVVGESGPGRCRFLGAGGHEEKQRCEKASGKLGEPAGGLKGRHISKSKRAQRAKKRLLRGGAVAGGRCCRKGQSAWEAKALRPRRPAAEKVSVAGWSPLGRW